MTMRVLILGAAGQVGTALQQSTPQGITVIPRDVPHIDIRDRLDLIRALDDARPNVVINCAAYTRVDDAEKDRDEAMAVNGVAPGLIAELSINAGARVIHISTDYVFDGTAHSPYATDAEVGPLNVYGATKLEGERRVLATSPETVVIRTAWVHSGGGTNFIKTAVRLLSGGTPMRVVDDQIGTPTRALHLAIALWSVVGRPDVRGLHHFTDAGVASWFDVAAAVLDTLSDANRLGSGASVSPARTEEFPRPARRPEFSVLDKHASWKAIGYEPPHWRHGVIASTLELMNG